MSDATVLWFLSMFDYSQTERNVQSHLTENRMPFVLVPNLSFRNVLTTELKIVTEDQADSYLLDAENWTSVARWTENA